MSWIEVELDPCLVWTLKGQPVKPCYGDRPAGSGSNEMINDIQMDHSVTFTHLRDPRTNVVFVAVFVLKDEIKSH